MLTSIHRAALPATCIQFDTSMSWHCWQSAGVKGSKCHLFPVELLGSWSMDRGTTGGGTLLPRGSHRVWPVTPTGIISSVSALTLQPVRCSSSVILESPSSPATVQADGGQGECWWCSWYTESISPGFSWSSVETVLLCVWAQEQKEYLCLYFSERHFTEVSVTLVVVPDGFLLPEP